MASFTTAHAAQHGTMPADGLMRPWHATLVLAMGYAIYAILLNSVGTVILQSIATFHVDKLAASTLEAFKDLTIAITSFTLAAQVPRLGLRLAMLLSLALAAAGCVLAAMAPALGPDGFWAMRGLFLCVGLGFALMKVAVYAAIGCFTSSASTHARMLGIVESLFMVAVVASGWIFAAFIDPAHPGSTGWLHVYWWLTGGCALTALAVLTGRFPAAQGPAQGQGGAANFAAMLGMLGRRVVQIFILGVFLYVFVEQGIGTWLPSINHLVLGLDEAMAVRAASVFALAIAAGRFAAGLVVARIGWFRLLLLCLGAMAVILALVPALAHGAAAPVSQWSQAPFATWLLAGIGFFMAPLYPTLNSVVLSSVPRDRQAGLIGLIVVFSALGGTTGSRMVALLFSEIPDARVLYSLLPPIAFIALVVVGLHRRVAD
jgi:MFS transporter, FHS family, glucose/mannose:H+ symporter